MIFALVALLWIIGYIAVGYGCYWRGRIDGMGIGRGAERKYNTSRIVQRSRHWRN